ncbi:MAG: signal peptidase II [Ktedonobacteraceae bacterium]|nr:signal peptidase II [Ktedonobacteraceae bacterium]
MLVRRARLYDAFALLTVIIIVAVDQWTKSLVVQYLSPPETKPALPLLGQYVVIYYIRNSGAAFGLFANTVFLALLIAAAVAVVTYLYIRIANSGLLLYKLIFAMIIGGALGNLIDRARNGGFVVDFISLRIPEINFYFAIFNIADACISVGVILLFVLLLFGGMGRTEKSADAVATQPSPLSKTGSARRSGD